MILMIIVVHNVAKTLIIIQFVSRIARNHTK